MATIFDVAAYIQSKKLPTHSPANIQKWLFYAQAWSLVLERQPLFSQDFQGWQHGPVCPELWREVDDVGFLRRPLGDVDALTEDQRGVLDDVLAAYGECSGFELPNKTHREAPWLESRVGLGDEDAGNRVIPKNQMASFYDCQGLESVEEAHHKRTAVSPELKAAFDEKFGEGEAERFLAQSKIYFDGLRGKTKPRVYNFT